MPEPTTTRPTLPIDALLPELVGCLRTHPALVLKAPPGAGKSTRVPAALLDAGFASEGAIWMLEPRRVAARSLAQRLASERGRPLGDEVGYQVRFEEKRSRRTRLMVVTEGILTRRFLRDPFLEGISCVVLDEFHERSADTDLCLAFARELLAVRDDFRFVVMSATLDTGPLAAFLGDCPVLECDVRGFPLTIRHSEGKDERALEIRVRAALLDLLRDPGDDGGDILAFLPGARDIQRCLDALREHRVADELDILPLFGALSADRQERALQRGARRRVVLATNLAETSLTVAGVTAVIDSGLEKRNLRDARTGLDRLETSFISKESAEQRAGRAGRTSRGRAIRLWSRVQHHQLGDRRPPELHRIDLSGALLAALAFQPGAPAAFPFYEPPPAAHLADAARVLEQLGAIRAEGGGFRVSDTGRRFLELPLPPRLAALLLRSAAEGALREGATLAALLSERDLVASSRRRGGHDEVHSSDLQWRCELLEVLESDSFRPATAQALGIDAGSARQVAEARDQLLRLFPPARGPHRTPDEGLEARLLLAAFPDRVCVRAGSGANEGRMVGGHGVELAPDSTLREPALFIAPVVEGRAGAQRGLVRMAAALRRADLEAVYPERVRIEEGAFFDAERRAVVGARRHYFEDLLLSEQSGVAVDALLLEAALADAAATHVHLLFRPDDDARTLQARVRLAATILPEEGWPILDDAWAAEVLRARAAGKRNLDALARIDWREEMRASLPWALARRLDAALPERIEVPSGSQIAVDYEAALGPAGVPILAVRLQEVFGWAETPTLAAGRVPLLLHLLAPNHRPVQVTRDLRSFWNQTYQEVRKELRQRYPKHAWPDDPWTAKAEAKPRRRR